MKLLQYIQLRAPRAQLSSPRAGATSRRDVSGDAHLPHACTDNRVALAGTSTCAGCIHFLNAPDRIEEAFPGLTSMSSGYASVRDQDGLCRLHQLYLSGRDSCADLKTI